MATHSSILAWEIPWTEEAGGLQSTRFKRVGHNLATKQEEDQTCTRYQNQDDLSREGEVRRPKGWVTTGFWPLFYNFFGDFPGGSDGKASACNAGDLQSRSLDWEDPLEKDMATHSSTLAWKILWTEEPGRLQSTGSQRVEHDERLHNSKITTLSSKKSTCYYSVAKTTIPPNFLSLLPSHWLTPPNFAVSPMFVDM